MDYYLLNVINLYKHNIVYNKVEKKRHLNLLMVAIIFVAVTVLAFGSTLLFGGYKETLAGVISYVYNPINPLYNDSSNIVFTSNLTYNQYNVEKDVEFLVPVITNKITFEQASITFEITDSVLVTASADGVVENVGTLESGAKYILIKHSKSLNTRYENVDIAGVVPGDEVHAGQDIATAKVGATVSFVVLYQNEPVENLVVRQNLVIWEK